MVNLSPHDFMSCKFYCRCTSSAHVQNVLEFDSIFPFLFCQLFAIVPIGAGAMGGKSLELAPWTWKGGRAVDPGLYTNVYDDLDTTPVRNSPTVQTVTLQTTNTGRADLFLYDFACICVYLHWASNGLCMYQHANARSDIANNEHWSSRLVSV